MHAADYLTLLAEVRAWILERMPGAEPAIDSLDRRLRQRLGTHSVYVPAQRKREVLARLAALPPDATPREREQASGLSATQTRFLWRMLGR